VEAGERGTGAFLDGDADPGVRRLVVLRGVEQEIVSLQVRMQGHGAGPGGAPLVLEGRHGADAVAGFGREDGGCGVGSSLGGDRGRVGAPWQVREPAEAVRGCIRADECWVAGGAEGHAFDVRDSFTTVGEAARERGYALRVVFAEVGRDRDLVAAARSWPGSAWGGEPGSAAARVRGRGERAFWP